MKRDQFEKSQERCRLSGLGPTPLEVAYRDTGEGPPVILIHGIPAWSFLWSKVIPSLAETARVIAPDLIGYGHSDQRDCFDRSVRRQARMVAALMDALSLEAATIVGHDIGGAVAQVLAVDHSSLVENLVLVNSVAYGSWPSSSMAALADPNLLERPEEIMSMVRHDAKVGHAEGEHGAEQEGVNASEREAFSKNMAAPYDTEEGRRSMVRNASGLNTNHTMEVAGRLESVDVPALVLWGAKDPWQPPADAERLAADLPNATLVTIPQGAHWVPYDHPRQTAHHLQQFLASPQG